MPLFGSMLYRHKVGHLKATASGDTCGQTYHSRAISISSLSDGWHLSRVKSLAQGRDVRTVQLQQPHFSDILDCVNLIPVCGLQLLLLLLHLAREAGCQACPPSSVTHQDFLVPWLKPSPDLKYHTFHCWTWADQTVRRECTRQKTIKRRRKTHQF